MVSILFANSGETNQKKVVLQQEETLHAVCGTAEGVDGKTVLELTAE